MCFAPFVELVQEISVVAHILLRVQSFEILDEAGLLAVIQHTLRHIFSLLSNRPYKTLDPPVNGALLQVVKYADVHVVHEVSNRAIGVVVDEHLVHLPEHHRPVAFFLDELQELLAAFVRVARGALDHDLVQVLVQGLRGTHCLDADAQLA